MRSPLPLLALWLLAAPARAHDADLIYVDVSRGPEDGALSERVTLTENTLALLIPLGPAGTALSPEALAAAAPALDAGIWDAMPLEVVAPAGGASRPCVRRETTAVLRASYVELGARFACPPGERKQTFRLLSVLPGNYRVVVGEAGQAGVDPRFAVGDAQTVFLPDRAPGEPPAPLDLGGWIGLGVLHIFTGYDHLCFLLALLVAGGTWRRVLVMVTAFTVAHSITLGAAALGVVHLDALRQRWVEIAIAASIVYVAAENLIVSEPRHRARVTFAFGLIHGFGFASVLQGYGLGQAVVRGLFGFNLGVELGQACVVIVLFPIISLIRKRKVAGARLVRLVSLGVLIAGGYWLVDRMLG